MSQWLNQTKSRTKNIYTFCPLSSLVPPQQSVRQLTFSWEHFLQNFNFQVKRCLFSFTWCFYSRGKVLTLSPTPGAHPCCVFSTLTLIPLNKLREKLTSIAALRLIHTHTCAYTTNILCLWYSSLKHQPNKNINRKFCVDMWLKHWSVGSGWQNPFYFYSLLYMNMIVYMYIGNYMCIFIYVNIGVCVYIYTHIHI